MTRHWKTPPTYYVWFPQGAASAGVDIFATAPAGVTGGPYTYCEFMQDVVNSFAKYSSITSGASFQTSLGVLPPGTCTPLPCPVGYPAPIGSPYTSMYATFGGISAPTPPLTTPPTPPPTANLLTQNNYAGTPATGTTLIWSTAAGGPTGDGYSEMIFLNAVVPGGGLTSMIMDPSSGSIRECDCIWGTQMQAGLGAQWPQRQTNQVCNPLSGCTIGGPGWTTGIGHEIGHFFGLDHTNLHPGHGNTAQNPLNPCMPLVIGNVPAILPAPSSHMTFTSTTQYPEMLARFTWVGYWRNDPYLPLHSDEVAAMAELYPVSSPGPANVTPGPMPLRNHCGCIEGSVSISSPPFTVPVLGANVIPRQVGTTDPRVGKLSGTCRLRQGGGVVGAQDTVNSIKTSGEFVIDGVGLGPAGLTTSPPAPGARFEVVVEPLRSLGIDLPPLSTPGTWGEWFYDPTHNPTLNPITAPQTAAEQVLVTSYGQTSMLWAGGPYGNPGDLSLGSLFVAPGTMNLPRFRGHPRRRENAPGVIHGRASEGAAEAAEVHGRVQERSGQALQGR